MDRAEEIARRLSARARRTGNGWLTLCPAHNDHEPSLHISPASEKQSQIVAHCFAGCQWEVLGPILRGYMVDGVPLKGEARVQDAPSARKWAGAHTPRVEPTLYSTELGEPIARWTYRTPEGGVWLYVARYAPNENERRPFRPWTWWRRDESKPPRCEQGNPPEGVARYPYRSDRLARGALGVPVIIAEGESSADAAGVLFEGCENTTWAGGCSWAGRTAWEGLRKRRVVLMPDEDRPGRGAMATIAKLLADITACWHKQRAVYNLTIASLNPEGGDVPALRKTPRDEDALLRWLTEERARTAWLRAIPLTTARPAVAEARGAAAAHEAAVCARIERLLDEERPGTAGWPRIPTGTPGRGMRCPPRTSARPSALVALRPAA